MATRNYLAEASRSATSARRYAVGGPMAGGGGAPAGPEMGGAPAPGGAPGGAPAGGPEQGGDPMAGLQELVAQYAQAKDPQLAVAIADQLVELMGMGMGAPGGGGDPMAGGGGGDPMAGGGAPAGGPPQMARKGGKLKSFGKSGMKGKAPAGKPAFGAKDAMPFGKKKSR